MPLLALCLWYALWVPGPDKQAPLSAPNEASVVVTPAIPSRHDLPGFRAPIWTASPQSATAVDNADPVLTPPASLQLDLIGIVQEPGPVSGEPRYLAAVFDRGEHRIFVVGSGERVGDFEVQSVDATAVDLRRGDQLVRLELEEWRLSRSGS